LIERPALILEPNRGYYALGLARDYLEAEFGRTKMSASLKSA